MRSLFANHEPADLTAILAFLEQGRLVALPQTAPAVFMMGVLSKAASYQTLLLQKFMALPQNYTSVDPKYEIKDFKGVNVVWT